MHLNRIGRRKFAGVTAVKSFYCSADYLTNPMLPPSASMDSIIHLARRRLCIRNHVHKTPSLASSERNRIAARILNVSSTGEQAEQKKKAAGNESRRAKIH